MRDAEAAQKKFEEKKAAMKEADDKRQALEKQKADLAKRQAEEKRKLQEKLAAKGQGSPPAKTNSEANDTTTNGVKDEAAAARTRALRAQVAALEAEAKSLGLDQALSDEPYPGYRGRGRGRGRGSYRGWEGFAGRGAYQPRGRGGYRGRGGGFGAYNLDLRPKKVGITGVEWTPEKDEGLRQYLLVSSPLSFANHGLCKRVERIVLTVVTGTGRVQRHQPQPFEPFSTRRLIQTAPRS